MKLQSVLVALLLVIGGALIGAMISPSASAQSQDRPIPRYQVSVAGDGNSQLIVICNTDTGKVWRRREATNDWIDLGQPSDPR